MNITDITIDSTNTPTTQLLGQDIVSSVRGWAPDLCYSFLHYDIKETASGEFEIKAKGSVPASASVCAEAIYHFEEPVRIQTTARGRHILRFYNNAQLFKADTVQVN